MIPAFKKFYADIYQENLAELGNHLLLFQAYFLEEELSWVEQHELNKRIDAYVDALSVGENVAIDFSNRMLYEGDEDEMLGAIYFLLSCPETPENTIFAVLESFASGENIALFSLAFKHARCPSLGQYLVPFLTHENPDIRAATVEVLGYRGEADPRRIWPLFHDKAEAVKLAAMNAVTRLGFKDACPAMELAVLDKKDIFNEHSVFPLLMLGSDKALQFSRLACRSAHHVKSQYPMYLALAGNEEDLDNILKVLVFGDLNLAVLEALGIFGALEGVNTLMKFLSSSEEDERLMAARSLNQISGAQLYDELAVAENEEEELSPAHVIGNAGIKTEKKAEDYQAEQQLVKIKRDCTNKDIWTAWWLENKACFDVSLRYRHGKPYSFFLLLQEIAHPETKHEDRQRAYNELVIRSGHYIAFEPDWFVDRQIAALKEWQTWWKQNKHTLSNQWMFHGK